MKVRLLSRTHYQVRELCYLKALVLICTFPTSSSHKEHVAASLTKLIRTKDETRFNVAAAGYAVDMAKGLGLLTDNLVWTERALVLRLVSQTDSWNRDLELAERIFFLQILLEFDGAALLYAAKRLLADKQIPSKAKSEDWNQFSNDMYRDIFTEYLDLITNVGERVKLREALNRKNGNRFSGKSGMHQSLFHLQAMYRLHLAKITGLRVYTTGTQSSVECASLRRLVELIPNLSKLERLVEEGKCLTAADAIVHDSSINQTETLDATDLEEKIGQIYLEVMHTGVNLCPLQTLSDVIDIRQSVMRKPRIGKERLVSALKSMQSRYPRSIRFHVDRLGFPAYVKIIGGALTYEGA